MAREAPPATGGRSQERTVVTASSKFDGVANRLRNRTLDLYADDRTWVP